jgi:hypothetical protein
MKLNIIFILFIAFITIYLSYTKTDTETNVNSNKMKSTKMRSTITADTQFMTIDKDSGEISSVKLDLSSLVSKPRTRQIFATVSGATTSTTIAIPTGVEYLVFEIIGGGGAGANAIGLFGGGGGGQSGLYLKGNLDLSGVTSIVCNIGLGGTTPADNTNGGEGGTTNITVIKNNTTYIISAPGGQGGICGSVKTPTYAGPGGFHSQAYTISPPLDISPVFSIIGGAGGNSNCAQEGKTYSTGGDGASSYFGGGGRGATSSSYLSSIGAYGSGGGGGSNAANPSAGNNGVGIFTYIL